MISGNKFNTFINTLFNIRSSSFAPVSTVTISSHNHEGTSHNHVIFKNLNQEHDYHKSTKSIYGSSCVNDGTHPADLSSSQQQKFFSGYHNTTPVFNLHTNIIMLVEMLATGLPFVGWRVKPDPGDWHSIQQRFMSIIKSIVWQDYNSRVLVGAFVWLCLQHLQQERRKKWFGFHKFMTFVHVCVLTKLERERDNWLWLLNQHLEYLKNIYILKVIVYLNHCKEKQRDLRKDKSE